MRRAGRLLLPLAGALLAGCGSAPEPAETIAAAIASVPAPPGVERSVWIGTAGGEALHAEAEEVPRPAASSIKTAWLVELFAERAGALDEPVPGAAAVLGDPGHPAVAHFDETTRQEIREHLVEATVATVGRHLIRGDGVSNAVYNAAANLAAAHLGGPAALTRRIHARDPAFAGIRGRRYMLAARDVAGDNEATASSLAAVLGALVRGETPGVPQEALLRAQEVLLIEETGDGRHYFKGGSLNSNPITRVLSGAFVGAAGPPGRALVHVFMAERPDPGGLDPTEAGEQLAAHLEAVRDRALPLARALLRTRS